MNPIMLIWFTTLILLCVFLALVNIATRNFIFTFFDCRMGRGKKIFITVKSLNDRYFRAGTVGEKTFIDFKDQQKKIQKITIPDDHKFEMIFGFKALTWDEAKNQIMTYDGTVQVYDTQKNQDLYERSIKGAEIKNTRETIKKQMIPVLALVGVVITCFLVYQVYQRQDLLYNNMLEMKTIIEAIRTTGVIK